ncbi:hypothetical protein JQN72_12595 [Phycicoccus sp. CSK15P-2]|uniref:hypothetical protein n=1 Tax=Phycicoccus sp. CSK15P-2 TaxID=2807627 RepID=UPI0019527A6A|nr:hypothetical protein [Phycicoccus sp. CSK15P-2]MBM6403618.1 hypothetical protein [Phycicoccus sp. CSK15P-2]MBM6405083.1 hypothetical protein [Phycicoccus sp. CSK15P-2]
MRLRWSGLRRAPVPEAVAAAVAPSDGERLLAWATTTAGETVVAGRRYLYVVAPDTEGAHQVRVSRPWHLVDAGTWSEEGVLRVTWVDGEPLLRVAVDEPGMFPETFRERVQASVVLAETLDLGPRRTAKVVVRRDLTTGRLLSQAVLGSGVRPADPGVAEEVRAGLARVREQVGLD